ncbi:MAG: ester cyclase [Bacteroidota bacterium]|nr:ester cyclase [Bacteroidota bacterium]
MENTRIVEDFLQAIERNDFTKAETYLARDFKVTGVAPDPLGANEFLGLHRAFNKGMPDFRFNYKIGKDKNNVVDLKVRLTGTHTKEMPAPIPGLHNITATNKSIKMPEEPIRVTIKDKKITTLHLEQVTGGGLTGLLKQIGVEMPEAVHH